MENIVLIILWVLTVEFKNINYYVYSKSKGEQHIIVHLYSLLNIMNLFTRNPIRPVAIAANIAHIFAHICLCK